MRTLFALLLTAAVAGPAALVNQGAPGTRPWPVTLSAATDAGGSPSNPIYTQATTVDAGMGQVVQTVQPVIDREGCLDIVNAISLAISQTPGDAGLADGGWAPGQNCSLVPVGRAIRWTFTGDACLSLNAVPSGCSDTSSYQGISRHPGAKIPEKFALLPGAATVMADGGAVPDGGTATTAIVCALPAYGTSVINIVRFAECVSAP